MDKIEIGIPEIKYHQKQKQKHTHTKCVQWIENRLNQLVPLFTQSFNYVLNNYTLNTWCLPGVQADSEIRW